MSRGCIAFFAAAALLLSAGPALAKVSEGDRASELKSIRDKRGKKVRLRDHRGKVIVLTFGASWCKPCKKELPAYEKLAKKYKKNGKKVVFIAINIDTERKNADAFIKEAGLETVIVGFDPEGNAVAKYEPGTMPTTYIINGKGIVKKVHAGYDKGDEKDIAAYVDKLLK